VRNHVGDIRSFIYFVPTVQSLSPLLLAFWLSFSMTSKTHTNRSLPVSKARVFIQILIFCRNKPLKPCYYRTRPLFACSDSASPGFSAPVMLLQRHIVCTSQTSCTAKARVFVGLSREQPSLQYGTRCFACVVHCCASCICRNPLEFGCWELIT
jgi:hypothetical protein